jgi:multicomponent Na+:H+ antiporter subunit G
MIAAGVALLLGLGLVFQAVAALGVIRLPDFYGRLHAVGKAETLGLLCSLAAVALWTGASMTTLKVVAVAVFLFLANPTATHALGRAAFRLGVRPWQRPERSS